ncbi:MAG TPA: hypothetical protein VHM19_02020, partial [Polyangiales bacterium]|nr:hypothetical protein [Polyangiales bacterium]
MQLSWKIGAPLALLLLSACAHAPRAIQSTLPRPDALHVDSDTVYAEACGLARARLPGSSHWVSVQPDGTLRYALLPSGDRVLDFSSAGYRGGGVALPQPLAVTTLAPTGRDDTAAIQAALDAAAAMPLVHGMRGAVWLAPGIYHVSQTLYLRASGVVLRGSGSDLRGTTLSIEGAPRTAIVVQGEGKWSPVGEPVDIVDAYVPVGARNVHVASAESFGIGDEVVVLRPITRAWVHFMGMDKLRRNGARETWLAPNRVMQIDRVVTGKMGNQITLDAPLPDALDRRWLQPKGARIVRYTFDGRIDRVGIESLRVVAPKRRTSNDKPFFTGVTFDAITNGFMRDMVFEELTAGIVLGETSKWITVQDVTLRRTAIIDGGAGYPFMISVYGQQTLVQRCHTIGDRAFSYATQVFAVGPNVVLDFRADGEERNELEPHQRWGTGLLVDNAHVSTGIDLHNRGIMGTGHGWTMGFGVIWNSEAARISVQYPPNAPNWSIGSLGEHVEITPMGSDVVQPVGIVDAPGTRVAPD